MIFRDGWVSGYNQQTVNLPLLAGYEGSNPSPSTRFSLLELQKTAGQSHQAMFESGLIWGVHRFAVATGKKTPLRQSAPQRTILEGDTDSAWVAQLVERVLGKDEVTGSIPVPGSRNLLGAARAATGEKFGAAPGGGNSTVESHSSKVMVAGSNPVPRYRFCSAKQRSLNIWKQIIPAPLG